MEMKKEEIKYKILQNNTKSGNTIFFKLYYIYY